VPRRFAHGFQLLAPDSEMTDFISEFYTPAAQGGLFYPDPRLAIQWPLPPTELSARDRQWALLEEFEPSLRERMADGLAGARSRKEGR
jgi:dTDP-4-dehydrorhamnose 3,5-epimerase